MNVIKNLSMIVLGGAIALELSISNLANAASLTIADSVNEFSSTQGQNNWYYGYYESPLNSSGFQQMNQYNNGIWWLSQGDFWTSLWANGGHPNGAITSGNRQEVNQWTVRRWISEVDGEITLIGNLAKLNSSGGNGIIGSILVDGQSIWSQLIGASDLTGVNYQLKANVKKGDFVDFVIDSNGNDWSDGTKFTTVISKDVPEPTTTLGLLISLGFFGLQHKRQKQQKVKDSNLS